MRALYEKGCIQLSVRMFPFRIRPCCLDDKIKLKDGSTNVKKKKDHIVNRGGRSCARRLNDSPF